MTNFEWYANITCLLIQKTIKRLNRCQWYIYREVFIVQREQVRDPPFNCFFRSPNIIIFASWRSGITNQFVYKA